MQRAGAMELWHATVDAPRTPLRVGTGEAVSLSVGTWPIAPGQSVWASVCVTRADGSEVRRVDRGRWVRNDAKNSYWQIELGRFRAGERVTYTVLGEGAPGAVVATEPQSFSVGAKVDLAILWHQHQPVYESPEHASPAGRLLQPWVRLHALRDYYSMASLVARFPGVHLTINLTPSLLRQIEGYERGVTDRALELTKRAAESLTEEEREEMLRTFFDASWHHQILPHPRYAELFRMRAEGRPFSVADLTDLQVWFSLAWFNPEFFDGPVELSTGERVDVSRLVRKERGFSRDDVAELVRAELAVLRAVVPIHRALQERGQIEVSTTPLYHPILPLLIDTDRATLDRPSTSLPRRFAHPEDAEAQVAGAVVEYRRRFGRPPRGMWPAEGAVSAECVPIFARHGIGWIASDEGVLERSGKWGYRTSDPDVLCRAYTVGEEGAETRIFFRHHGLSDLIGFSLQHVPDPELAAHELLRQLKERLVRRFAGAEDRVVSIILDGENPWGSYQRAGIPFLSALYGLLERDPEIRTVTFSEYLDADPTRAATRLHELYTGSWIDELGSHAGVDLGTWIGEQEENYAWEMLGDARDALAASGATPEDNPEAYESLWMAEGSDWFWWFGSDQDSGRDDEFDALFRGHVRNVYRGIGLEPPPETCRRFVATVVPWSFSQQVDRVFPGDRLQIRTNCTGVLGWQLGDGVPESTELVPTGGVMDGPKRYQAVIGPLPEGIPTLRIRFRCANGVCDHMHVACRGEEHTITIVERRAVPRRERGYEPSSHVRP